MALLGFACVALGVAPFVILAPLDATVFDLTRTHADMKFDWSMLVANDSFGWVAPLWIAFGLVAFLMAIPLALHLMELTSGAAAMRQGAVGAHYRRLASNIPATAFANPFKRVFALLYRSVKELDVEFHPESRYFVRSIEYCNEGRLIFENALYRPLLRAIESSRAKREPCSQARAQLFVYILLPSSPCCS